MDTTTTKRIVTVRPAGNVRTIAIEYIRPDGALVATTRLGSYPEYLAELAEDFAAYVGRRLHLAVLVDDSAATVIDALRAGLLSVMEGHVGLVSALPQDLTPAVERTAERILRETRAQQDLVHAPLGRAERIRIYERAIEQYQEVRS